jgi:hypothetical protein
MWDNSSCSDFGRRSQHCMARGRARMGSVDARARQRSESPPHEDHTLPLQGFRTGHVYRQPLLRARNIAVSTVNQNDVAVPPAASSVGAVSIDCPLHMCNRAWLRSMKRTRTR